MHSLEKKNLESDNDEMLDHAPVDGSNDDSNEPSASNKKMFEESGGFKNQYEADLNAFLAV